MKAHTLAREEIEGWRVNIDQLMGGSEEDTIQINVLCDMALEALEARIRAFTKPEIAAICELDGCCMLRSINPHLRKINCGLRRFSKGH